MYKINYIQTFLLIIGVLTLIIGALNALEQHELKRLLGFSSINHLGYLIIALSCGLHDVMIIYLIGYTFASFLLFYSFLSLIDALRKHMLTLASLLSIYNRFPTILIVFIIISFCSYSALPPLMGFYCKYYVLFNLMEIGVPFVVFLSLLTTLFATIYYIRMIKYIFFKPSSLEKNYWGDSSEIKEIIPLYLSLWVITFVNFSILLIWIDLYDFSLLLSLYL